jgi:hypothetical protein
VEGFGSSEVQHMYADGRRPLYESSSDQVKVMAQRLEKSQSSMDRRVKRSGALIEALRNDFLNSANDRQGPCL